MDKVSIIVPVYNIENYLCQCVDSLISQTYENIEIILINDGSTDSSGSICNKYAMHDARVKVIHKSNGGQTSARNAGLEAAIGKWISYIDGDDYVSPSYIALLVGKADETEADIVFADFFFDYGIRTEICRNYDWTLQGLKGLEKYIAYTWTCLWGNIHRRSLYTDNDLGSPTDITYCEDFHLMIRLCFFAGKIAKVSEALYYYRQQAGSIMHNLNKKTERDERWAYADTINFLKNHDSYSELKQVMAWRTLKAAQELALDPATFSEFRAYNPDKKEHIINCPFIGLKLKMIAWCLTHRLGGISFLIVKIRKFIGR